MLCGPEQFLNSFWTVSEQFLNSFWIVSELFQKSLAIGALHQNLPELLENDKKT